MIVCLDSSIQIDDWHDTAVAFLAVCAMAYGVLLGFYNDDVQASSSVCRCNGNRLQPMIP